VQSAVQKEKPTEQLPLLDWTRRFLGHIQTLSPSRFHYWLSGELDSLTNRRGARLNVLAPRAAAKSSYASLAYPLREALEGREEYIVLTSDSGDQAKAFMEKIRSQLTENEAILKAYPSAAGKGSVWRDKHIKLRNGVEILALGSGGKIRGRSSSRNRRPSLIILDDPQNKDHIFSSLKRGRSWEFLTKDVLSAGDQNTNVVVLGTALHREAIVCRLESTPGWNSRKWKSIITWPTRMDLWQRWEELLFDYSLEAAEDRVVQARAFYEANKGDMDEGAEVLWPERRSLYDLMLKRASDGHAAFHSEEMNDPISPESCEWPEEYTSYKNMWFDEWTSNMVIKTMAWDPSKGKDAKLGDYSAITMFGVDRAGLEHVETVQLRKPVSEVVELVVDLAVDFNPAGIALETVQFQELLLPMLREVCRRKRLDRPLPTYHFNNTENKNARIRTLTQSLAQKRFRFKKRSPGTTLLLDQLRDWPSGEHDDGPDSLQMARALALELIGNKAMKRERTVIQV